LRERKADIQPIVIALGDILKITPLKVTEFLDKYTEDFLNEKIDLSLNVRSLEQALKRYITLGRL
jgi:hypothetical protein